MEQTENTNNTKSSGVTRKLYLSATDYKIAGVCGGVAEYFRIDSVVVRLAFVFLAVITAFFPMFIFYLLAWAVMPRHEDDN
jgi:phage shock protein PspC (stress-responsive transcriptional regulator)